MTARPTARRRDGAAPDARHSQARGWWEEFFGEDYRLSDLDRQPDERTAAQARCAASALGLAPGARVLDLACGTGRHAAWLGARGFDVTGVDLNADYLRRADSRARAAGARVRFVRADMRDLRALGAGTFDGAISMYTSFGFFEREEDNLRVLEEIGRVLRPGGGLCLDVINRDWLLRSFAPSDFAEQDGRFVIRDYDEADDGVVLHEDSFDPRTSRLTWRITRLAEPGGTVVAPYRVYSVHELLALLERAALRPERVLGAYDESPFAIFSPRLIAIARKA